MAKGYRTRSSTGATGNKRTTTQSQSGKVKTTMSYKTGSSSNLAISRNANGSVVQRTTRKTGDGFVVRKTKTLISAPKTPKAPKPPKPPRASTAKVAKEYVYKPPRQTKSRSTSPKVKPIKFNWGSSRKSVARKRTTSTSKSSNGFLTTMLTYITLGAIFMIFVAVIQAIFS